MSEMEHQVLSRPPQFPEERPEVCPKCGGALVIPINTGEFHCNQCGHSWRTLGPQRVRVIAAPPPGVRVG